MCDRIKYQKKNLYFLNNIDPNYFYNYTEIFKNKGNITIPESIIVKNCFFHAVETFFTILFSILQAPFYVLGWLQFYKLDKIKKLIKVIENNDKSFKYFKVFLDNYSWDSISKLINRVDGNTSKIKDIEIFFTNYWSFLAKIFVDDDFHNEYNSIKHGFRSSFGGFNMSIKKENDQNSKFRKIKGSIFGSSYFVIDEYSKTEENINQFCLMEHFQNWDIENIILNIELLSYSINNLKSFGLILNGIPGNKVYFEFPEDIEK